MDIIKILFIVLLGLLIVATAVYGGAVIADLYLKLFKIHHWLHWIAVILIAIHLVAVPALGLIMLFRKNDNDMMF